MKKIAVVTATRAEYGLLAPLMKRIKEDNELELDLIVTGGHLSKQQGYTVKEICEDGFLIAHKIPILDPKNSAYGASLTIANAVKGFAECFQNDRPDMAVLLGDRTEMIGVALAAMNERIPIAHISGGEVTMGAVDDCVRHALTKMSYLHFPSTEIYRRRIIKMGESPDRVFNYGALGAENIRTAHLMDEESIRNNIGIPKGRLYAVVTFHPVTLEDNTSKAQAEELCAAISMREKYFYLITMSNTDVGGDIQNQVLQDYVFKHDNAKLVSSLGRIRYLSAMKYAAFVLGNSSSGMLEAPVFGVPTVNIGDRQRGRILTETIVNCKPERSSICEAIDQAAVMKHVASQIYGDGLTSEKIVLTLKGFLEHKGIDLKKGFYEEG